MTETKTETRRKNARAKIVSEIAYLNFDSGNGAIVLDVSRDGIGFQAADRLSPNESVPCRLCTADFPNIELSAEVVWLDETRKRGGLRMQVPAHSRPTLDKWLRKHFDSLGETESPTNGSPAAAPPAESPRPSPPQPERNPNPAASIPSFGFRPPARPAGHGPIFVSEWQLPPEESHTGRNVLVLCVILVLGLAIAGSYFFGGRRQLGGALIRLGQSLVGTSSQAPLRTLDATNANALPAAQPNLRSQSAATTSSPAAAQPAAAPTAPPASTSSAPGTMAPNLSATPTQNSAAPRALPPNLEAASAAGQPNPTIDGANSTADAPPPVVPQPKTSPAGNSSSPAAFSATAPSNHGQSDVAQARELLRDSNPQASAVAAELLWSAVGKGNTQAEMMLADLYLEGRGTVRKNCRQAEALLTAAQSASVPGAEQKIQELQTYGCR
jgi:PilZ domain